MPSFIILHCKVSLATLSNPLPLPECKNQYQFLLLPPSSNYLSRSYLQSSTYGTVAILAMSTRTWWAATCRRVNIWTGSASTISRVATGARGTCTRCRVRLYAWWACAESLYCCLVHDATSKKWERWEISTSSCNWVDWLKKWHTNNSINLPNG